MGLSVNYFRKLFLLIFVVSRGEGKVLGRKREKERSARNLRVERGRKESQRDRSGDTLGVRGCPASVTSRGSSFRVSPGE